MFVFQAEIDFPRALILKLISPTVPVQVKGGGQKKSRLDQQGTHLDDGILNQCWENLVSHPKITESTQSALYMTTRMLCAFYSVT